MAEEMANELAKGVQNMAMNGPIPDLNAQVSEQEEESKDRISGLDSYNGTSEKTTSVTSKQGQESLSMSERFQMVKGQKAGIGNEKKSSIWGLISMAGSAC